ncbi:MAG: bifunctional riboflavin kinase/FAD synthetase [Gemmatimonadaceae bacterium]
MSSWDRPDFMRDDSPLPPDVHGTVITVGTFDGVHRGHQDVLARLVQRAQALGARSVLLTFDPHPLEVVNPAAAPPLLTVGDEKLEVLAESGIDYVAVIPFTRELAALDAERFVDEVLVGRYSVRHLLMGHDHGFGRNRAGDEGVLRELGQSRGFSVEAVEPVIGPHDQPVSSTAIRRAVAGGDLDRAAEGLGRPYAVGGRVRTGEKRGRLLGFPTINVPLPSARKLLPPQGVYAVRVQTPLGPFGGMLNLGPRPTFNDADVALEAHLFDASGDFYGMRVRIDFLSRLRDTQRFDSIEALVAQLREDERAARQVLG